MKKHYFLFLSLFVMALTVRASDLTVRHPFKSPCRVAYTLDAPVVKEATDVTETGFTANWEPVSGADAYCCFVYDKAVAPHDGEYVVLSENFNLIDQGSSVEPVFPDEFYIDLSVDYDYVMSPNWTVLEPIFAGGMVGGVIFSPYIDLTNDGGRFKVVLHIVGYSGQEIKVTSSGVTEEVKSAILELTGDNEVTFDFDNGTHDTYLCIVDNGFPNDEEDIYGAGYPAFLDEFAVVQDLDAGDEVLRLVDLDEGVEYGTERRFDDMKFRYEATTLYYDVYAAARIYEDPTDEWSYETVYSPFSSLQQVILLGGNSGIEDGVCDEPVADVAAGTGCVTITSGTPVSYEILSIFGQTVARGECQSQMSVALPSGVYMVKAGNLTAKLLVR